MNSKKIHYILSDSAFKGSNWILTNSNSSSRLQKMVSAGVPLDEYVNGKIYRGILTGFNKAFIIDGKKRAELIAEDSRSAEIIKPLAVGDNLRKWHINAENKWLIFTPIGINVNNYSAVFSHLKCWKTELEKRSDKGNYWWELRACSYYNIFDLSKIIFPAIVKESRFTFDTQGNFLGNTGYIIPVNDMYLLGILNSTCTWEYAKNKFVCLGDPNKGGRFRFIYQSVKQIPIPDATTINKEIISNLVQKCLNAKGIDCEEWEKEIDERVAALYGL